MGLSWFIMVYHGLSPTCPVDPPANHAILQREAKLLEAVRENRREKNREDVCFLLM